MLFTNGMRDGRYLRRREMSKMMDGFILSFCTADSPAPTIIDKLNGSLQDYATKGKNRLNSAANHADLQFAIGNLGHC